MLIFYFVAFAFGIRSERSLPQPMSESFSYKLTSRRFTVSSLMFTTFGGEGHAMQQMGSFLIRDRIHALYIGSAKS